MNTKLKNVASGRVLERTTKLVSSWRMFALGRRPYQYL